jgi:SOS regulatory protein LexA
VKMKKNGLSTYKNNRFFIFQGESGTGKTNAALERAAYLENEYCIYSSDNILMITDKDKEPIYNTFNKFKENTSNLTLFSSFNNGFQVMTIEELIDIYGCQYEKKTSTKAVITSEHKIQVLESTMENIKKKYTKSKLLSKDNVEFLLKEIEYIKGNRILTLEEYQNFVRKGRVKRLPRNSKVREIIFSLLEAYNKELKKTSLFDEYDKEAFAEDTARNSKVKKYSHIIIDNSENLTKSQLMFVKALFKNLSYSNMIIILNKDNALIQSSFLRSSSSIKNFDSENKYKTINFKNIEPIKSVEEHNNSVTSIYNKHTNNQGVKVDDIESLSDKIVEKTIDNLTEVKDVIEEDMSKEKIDVYKLQKSIGNLYMDYFDYCDLKHGKIYSFAVDNSGDKEVILNPYEDNETIPQEDLRSVTVYSDIAAGEPILISDDMEGTFDMPNYWLKGVKDAFMLKVKGDSMIGASIEDGDYVLIKKQSTANNKDIVAVDLDGNATLKRLSIKKDGIFLMPENPKYEPIKVHSEGAMIIGTAIGVLKRK